MDTFLLPSVNESTEADSPTLEHIVQQIRINMPEQKARKILMESFGELVVDKPVNALSNTSTNLTPDRSPVQKKVQDSEVSYQQYGISPEDTDHFSVYDKIYGQSDPGKSTAP